MTTTIDTTATPDGSADEVGLRERKKLQTRRAIHEAAFHLIDENGLEATTIDQICAVAEVSSRTFFNYYPSKAAAALELTERPVSEEARARFLAADGSLVLALCDVLGESSELGPSHARMKKLIGHRPELITTLSQMMNEVRGQFVTLAAERTDSLQEAELAVTMVMMAIGRTMHEDSESDAPLSTRLRATIAQLGNVLSAQLGPAGTPIR